MRKHPPLPSGTSRPARPTRGPGGVAVLALACGTVLAACSGSTTPPGTSSGSNGSGTIDVGSIATITGVGAGDFASFIPGMQAYFDMVNAHGGVNGHHLVLAKDLDDGGSPTTFTQLAHTLIEQDHSFAVFVSTFWFSPNIFTTTGTPTYGYNVSGNWAGPDNLFAAGGSIQDYHAIAPRSPTS